MNKPILYYKENCEVCKSLLDKLAEYELYDQIDLFNIVMITANELDELMDHGWGTTPAIQLSDDQILNGALAVIYVDNMVSFKQLRRDVIELREQINEIVKVVGTDAQYTVTI
jgi:glutaredoxin-related protein